MSQEEKQTYLKTVLADQICLVLFGDPNNQGARPDSVHEVAVEETLFQDVSEALQDMCDIPEKFTPQIKQLDVLNNNFKEYCKTRKIKPIPIEQYAYPFDISEVPHEALFITVHTADQYARAETQEWLKVSGILEHMAAKGFTLQPTYEEARNLLLVGQMFEVLSLKASESTKKVELASAKNVNMFGG